MSPDAITKAKAEADAFLAEPHRHLIDGQTDPGSPAGQLEVRNPATGAVIATIADGSAADVEAAVAAARAAFDRADWAGITPARRAQWLFDIADAIEANGDVLAELEYRDNGKARHIIRAGDIAGAAATFRYYGGWATKIAGQTLQVSRPGATFAYTLREPVGVAGLIIPWNFPLVMAAWKLAPALAAGCTAVLKPAEETSLSALYLGRIITDLGLPAGVVNIVTGVGHRVGAALAAHPGVDKVAFTGSTEVGRAIVRAATGNLKKVSLELGGKSPTIILPDADMARAIPAAAMGIFFNAGQVCAAGSRLYVHRDCHDQVLEGVIAFAEKLRLGPGDNPDSQIGPLISASHRERVDGYVRGGREAGAEVLTGGGALDGPGYFYRPTVMAGARPDSALVREEVFGPVLVSDAFDDLDEVVAAANDSIYGLNATIWTRDLGTAHRLARRLQSGSVRVNAGGGTDPNLPFGGYKQSGWGREFGAEGLDLYLQTKSVLMEF